MTRTFTLLAASLALLAGCGNLATPSQGEAANVAAANAVKGGSCVEAKSGICTDYNDGWSGLAERSCKDTRKGTYSKESCSQANVMGTCVRHRDKRVYYFGGALPLVKDAVEHCEKDAIEAGTFIAAPGAIVAAQASALPKADRIVGSCTSSSKSCEDVWGDMPESYKATCEQFGGKFATTACDKDKLVASCVKNGKVERFYEKDLRLQTLNQLQDECEELARPFGHFYRNPSYKAVAATPHPHAKKARR